MLRIAQKVLFGTALAGLLIFGAMMRTTIVAGQTSTPPAPSITPQSPNVLAGEYEAKRLLFLMDQDKDGRVSRQEYMAFMAAEFDRLDVNKDGYLDVKELERSQFVRAHPAGGHR